MKSLLFVPAAACALALPVISRAATLEVTASNPLDLARPRETLEIAAADLARLGEADLTKIHVRDAKGAELVCQAIDLDGDDLRKPDAVIFQADFAPGETRRFTVSSGKKQVFKKEQYGAFGRFVRERFDDFAWENDKVAHRTYGKALETWKGEPLTSSTIDVWSKRTPRMVINDWYLADDYHVDHGEGADFYSAGPSRGCGGSGLWADGKLWTSANFVNSKVLANGPIRVLFELEYAPYPVGGASVSETKRVSLDAGSQFNRFVSRYRFSGTSTTTAIGLKKVVGEEVRSGDGCWLAKWEPVEKRAGHQGLAVVVDPRDFDQITSDTLNHLVVLNETNTTTATWWAGSCWDKAGEITSAKAWRDHVAHHARKLAEPIRIAVKPVD